MPRPRLLRDPCDCADCRWDALPAGAAGGGTAAAVARQEPPPKSLVLCLAGALRTGSSMHEAHVPHLDAVVHAGWAGLLACRSGGPQLALQLLGLRRAGEAPAQGLADRFKQLRALLLTNSQDVAEAGTLAGCYAVHQLAGSSSNTVCPWWQPPEQMAARICQLLQVQPLPPSAAESAMAADPAPALAAVLAAAGQPAPSQQEEEEGDDAIDMLLLVLNAAQAAAEGDGSNHAVALEWADSLVRCLNQVPGFKDTVLLSLVSGPGEHPLTQLLLQQGSALLLQPGMPAAAAAAEEIDCAPVCRPLQSHQFGGLEQVSVDMQRPAVVVHRLPGVIRVDRATKLDAAHIAEHGAAGCILAERLLPEVAYKLGRAHKYGA